MKYTITNNPIGDSHIFQSSKYGLRITFYAISHWHLGFRCKFSKTFFCIIVPTFEVLYFGY